MNDDPGNHWCPEKKLSERLQQIRNQWLNLGERQQGMLDNLVLSAEHLEEKLARSETAAIVQVLPLPPQPETITTTTHPVAWGPEQQNYPGGPIYRVGSSTGVDAPSAIVDGDLATQRAIADRCVPSATNAIVQVLPLPPQPDDTVTTSTHKGAFPDLKPGTVLKARIPDQYRVTSERSGDKKSRLIDNLREHAEAFAEPRVMEHWDKWRAAIANGCKASWPRDGFESLIDGVAQDCAAAADALSAPSARGPIFEKFNECRAPSRVMTIGGASGEWYCGSCGASNREPECRYLKSASTDGGADKS